MPWVDIPNSVFESGKPARALDMRNLRDNFAAMAAGNSGAPKIKAPALEVIIPYVTATGTTPSATFTGINPRTKWLEFDLRATNGGAGSNAVQVGYSDDGGTNWTAFSSLLTLASGASAVFRLYVDLSTGNIYHTGAAGVISAVGSTLPGGATNAIRFRMNAAASTIQGLGKEISGRT